MTSSHLWSVLIGASFLISLVIVFGIAIPRIVRLISLIWLHDIRDSVYELILFKNPWLARTSFYRLGEVILTSSIFLFRHGGYQTLINFLDFLVTRKRSVDEKTRAFVDGVLAELQHEVGEGPNREHAVHEFIGLVESIKKPILLRLAFGHLLAIPFGILFFSVLGVRTLVRRLRQHGRPVDGTKEESVIQTALDVKNLADEVKRPRNTSPNEGELVLTG